MGWDVVGTLPSGSGTVSDATVAPIITEPLTSEAILNLVSALATGINVKNYGAVGDGVTDDTDAINDALQAVNPALGFMNVVIPDGDYMINGVNIWPGSNASQRYIDAGLTPIKGTTITMTPGAILRTIPNNSPSSCVIYIGPGQDDVTVRGGQIIGDRVEHDYAQIYPSPDYNAHEHGYGIVNRGAKRTRIEGVEISQCHGDGFLGSNSGHFDHTNPAYLPGTGSVVGCKIHHNRRNNCSLIGNAFFLFDDNDIDYAGTDDGYTGEARGSEIPFNPKTGIDLEYGTSERVLETVVRNNRFKGNANSSVNDFNGRKAVIEGNFGDNSFHVGVHSDNEVIIQNNVVINTDDTTSIGISCETSSVATNNVLIANNMVIGFSVGIRPSGLGIHTTGNHVSKFTTAGIMSFQVATGSVEGNFVYDAVTGGTAAGITLSSPTVKGQSVTSLAIGTGSKVFTVTRDGTNPMLTAFPVGSVIRATGASSANTMTGTVTAATTTSVTLNVYQTTGVGTFAAWTLAHASSIDITNNQIDGCYYGVNFVNSPVGATVKGNNITRGFRAFNIGGGTQAVIEGNTSNLPGHPDGQGNDILWGNTSDIALIKNTFINSTMPSISATSGGTNGRSRIIGNKIIDSRTTTSGIACSAGTHEVVDNTLSCNVSSGTIVAIAITGASVNSKVMGNIAYSVGSQPWSRLVDSSAATGVSPSTFISGNVFDGAVVGNYHSSDIVGVNYDVNGVVAKRILAQTTATTLTVDASRYDMAKITAQNGALTIAAPTGSPTGGQELLIRIRNNGSAAGITWNSVFRALGDPLPTTTVNGETTYVHAYWNSDESKWDAVDLSVTSGGSSTALDPTVPLPEDQGLIGWAYDPVGINTGVQLTAGSLVLVRIPIREPQSITNVIIGVVTAGATLTAGQNFAGLYQGNSLIALTADQTTAWQSAGLMVMPLVGGPYAVSAGFVEVAFWSNGTTRPSVARADMVVGTFANAGLTVGVSAGRFSSSSGGVTTTPPATITARSSALPYWAAVS